MRTKHLLFGLTFILACSKNHDLSGEHAVTPVQKIREQGSDFLIPSQAWNLLLQSSEDLVKLEGKKKSEEEGELITASFAYAPLFVLLKEKNRGVLKESEYRLELPDGGGQIDLAKYVTRQVGSFYVDFEFEGQESQAKEQKVLFYSRTKKRKIGNDFVGTGCLKLLDLSSSFSAAKREVIKVNTTRSFHATVLGGHFLFSWLKDGVRKVARVSFVDSEQPQLFCEKEK